MPPSHSRTNSVEEELIELGHNWFIHNPNQRAVRVRYEAIDSNHPALRTAETSLDKIARVLLQIDGCRATIVPCLHRAEIPNNRHVLGVVLHMTMLNVEVLEMVHLMQSVVPVHLFIGEPLTTATSFDLYSPDKLTIPDHLEPGDPLFCSGTQRAMVFGAYLHAADGDNALYGITVGQAVVPHSGFAMHPRLKPRGFHQRRVRSSQLAIQQLGRPLSNPAVQVVEQTIRASELEQARIYAELERTGQNEGSPLVQRRLQQHQAQILRLRESLTRSHEYDVGHACAAEALIRPCNSTDHRRHSGQGTSHRSKRYDDGHTHLLSWTLMRMASKASDNPVTLHAYPGTLERGAAVSMHVRDPNVERPLGPYRDGVVNGAPATVIIGGQMAREWAVFPAPGHNSIKFAARGDAGALVTSALGATPEEGAVVVPLALLYAAPERGPYGLVTPLTTVLRRIRDVTGMHLRFQGSWWRNNYG
ncbi:hypothetical protein C8T65DRAFT_741089 [Cerioporus squamosus]|nr:hypothetical protein C8T65DRAFT_741089 [Cerioporus squamosus]